MDEDFIRGLRDGDLHQGGIRCLRLLRLELSYFDSLRAEVVRLVGAETASVAGDLGHVTRWTRPRGVIRQFSLLNRSGRFEDFSTDHDLSCVGKRFDAAARFPSLARLVAGFPHAVNFRISAMAPGARLPPHEEHLLFRTRAGTVGMRLRCHLPILTETAAVLTLDGEVYHLEPGAIDLVNHGCVHAAANDGRGRTDRSDLGHAVNAGDLRHSCRSRLPALPRRADRGRGSRAHASTEGADRPVRSLAAKGALRRRGPSAGAKFSEHRWWSARGPPIASKISRTCSANSATLTEVVGVSEATNSTDHSVFRAAWNEQLQRTQFEEQRR